MKKIFTLSLVISLFAVGSVVQAKVETVSGPWALTAPSAIDFSCGAGTYSHTLDTVTQGEGGAFTGTGSADTQVGYFWNIVGNISGDDITFTIVYTGNNSGYTLNLDGTIAPDGSISGTSDGNCQGFLMPTDSAIGSFEGNHGQYVKSQDNKKVAAQSRVGMPVKSKGHTK